ncbi:hypothetical protein DY000_02054362 [Brassica cretica]|uniref:Uncharacterized protein n=1 Tax=Brassica cretica TaxID=69181 RepID=A0ABQ7AMM3_BRACR|nr:hypothetical protein DY000_02054362 [Brassica cretica]
MKKVMKIIKPKPDPKQRLRDWQRKLRQECRNIERQIRGSALAKEIVSSRRTVNKLYENKAQMNSISMHLGESIGLAVMSRLARNRMQQPGYEIFFRTECNNQV